MMLRSRLWTVRAQNIIWREPGVSYHAMSSLKASSQATSYERGSESQKDAGIKMIDKLEVQKGSIVIDLGCGTGSVTKVLSERVGPEGKVVAVDPDEERLKMAREKYSASNTEYIQADDKTFPAGQYDLVFCNAVIHWIGDKEGLYKCIYKNLHPRGRFAFTTPDGHLPIPVIGKKLFDELLGCDFLHRVQNERKQYLTASEYKTLASATGFEQTSMTIRNLDLKWKNLDHYIDSMHGWFQGEFDPTQVDGDALQKLKEDYGDGPVFLPEPIRVLEVILTKSVLK